MKIDVTEAWAFCEKNWTKIGAVLAFIGACAVFPFKLLALEKNDAKQDAALEDQRAMQRSLYEQTTAMNQMIQLQAQRAELEEKHEREMEAAAPPGTYWDRGRRKYMAL